MRYGLHSSYTLNGIVLVFVSKSSLALITFFTVVLVVLCVVVFGFCCCCFMFLFSAVVVVCRLVAQPQHAVPGSLTSSCLSRSSWSRSLHFHAILFSLKAFKIAYIYLFLSQTGHKINQNLFAGTGEGSCAAPPFRSIFFPLSGLPVLFIFSVISFFVLLLDRTLSSGSMVAPPLPHVARNTASVALWSDLE